MKKIAAFVVLCLSAVSCLGDDAASGKPKASKIDQLAEEVVKRHSATKIRMHAANLLSKKRKKAEAAIAYFRRINESGMVCIALYNYDPSVCVSAAEALENIATVEDVPRMVEVLKRECRWRMGSSEVHIPQQMVRDSLLRALSRATGIDMDKAIRLNEERRLDGTLNRELSAAIDKVKAWQKEGSKPPEPGRRRTPFAWDRILKDANLKEDE